MRAAIATVPLAAVLAACGLLTDPRPELPPAELPVEVRTAHLEPGGDVFSVEGVEGAVLVRDRILTGVCHRYEDEGAYMDGEEVVLWIAHTVRKRAHCQDIGLLRPFEARIEGLEPGERRVRVDYIGYVSSDSRRSPADLRATVTVR